MKSASKTFIRKDKSRAEKLCIDYYKGGLLAEDDALSETQSFHKQ